MRAWILSISMFLLGAGTIVHAHVNPEVMKKPADGKPGRPAISYRNDCVLAKARVDQAINNVRARLRTGGDVWWDPGSGEGRYIVPKVAPGIPEVSSIFAGAVWLGGVDPGGNLKVACQTYGSSSNRADFWPGPLRPSDGKTDQESCTQWDRFFTVTGEEIDEHIRKYDESVRLNKPYRAEEIPRSIKGWPAQGNEFFFDVHGFELPETDAGLAGFFDRNFNSLYEPEDGDFPIIEIRGCIEEVGDPKFRPDEMHFWIYNDAGNIHSETRGDPIQMEVQVQSFAYATNDQINDMTFQRYKLINRAVESIDSMFFAMWVDADLGCYTDDYVGCDTLRSLAYIYNADAVDGQTGCNCPQAVNTYCEMIPIIGVDYFRGPLDENGNELGMSSFTYYNNGSVAPTPPGGTTDPNNAREYYNYLTGSWRDGSPFTFGCDAYQDGSPIKYAFTEAPDNTRGWSMCTANLPQGDRRTIQASGPFRLDPGAVNELIIGAVWIPDQDYPCPSIRKLQEADDIAQALFNNCFRITDGPDAPDVDLIELDREIIAIFTNDTISSNNKYESYAQTGLEIPETAVDSLYRFEGYKLYQLASPDVTLADLENPDKARLIYQVDIKNNVGKVYNWVAVENPLNQEVYAPVLEVDGGNQGVRHTFRITEDQFAQNDRRLINHKKYYFTAIAYAYNNYEQFDPRQILGQRKPYLEGRRNIGDGFNIYYTAIPRPIVDRQLNAIYGEGVPITRIDGVGAGGSFLDLTDESREASFSGTNNGELDYKAGNGPFNVSIFNPLDVVDGEYELTVVDGNLADNRLDAQYRWKLTNLSNPGAPVFSDFTLDKLNEQIIPEFGFSITMGQTADVGARADATNGAIGYFEEYKDPNGDSWLSGVADDMIPDNLNPQLDGVFNYVATGDGELDADDDPTEALTKIGSGYFVPYVLLDYRDRPDNLVPDYLRVAWGQGGRTVRSNSRLANVNNIDIVFTADKSKWSRCVVIETASDFFLNAGFQTEGNRKPYDLRAAPSVGKDDTNGDGKPDPDGTGEGMGWFPGYAVDVETGTRLNIFFGENSTYDGSNPDEQFIGGATGRDMMFNPTSDLFLNTNITNAAQVIRLFLAGGHHFVLVSRTKYDECAEIKSFLEDTARPFRKERALRDVTWAGFPMMASGTQMKSYAEGLIPNDLVVKLRVDNPYQVATGTGEFKGYPTYRFKLEGKAASALTEPQVETALDMINVVPNPYYGYSSYEISQFTTTVKVTNLPPKATVTIYSLDGKFIRQYKRDEIGIVPEGQNRAIARRQITPDLEWDLKNNKGIPVSSGVYLIHIDAGDLGQRIIKWFGVNRQFDPSGL